MRLIAFLALITLCSCGQGPIKTQEQAIYDVRLAFSFEGKEFSDKEIKEMMDDICDDLDDHPPRDVVSKIKESPALAGILMDNATESFCPKHHADVMEYLVGG